MLKPHYPDDNYVLSGATALDDIRADLPYRDGQVTCVSLLVELSEACLIPETLTYSKMSQRGWTGHKGSVYSVLCELYHLVPPVPTSPLTIKSQKIG